MMRSLVVAIVVAGAAISILGCGSDDEKPNTEVKREAYAKQANRVCETMGTRYSEEVKNLVEEKNQTEAKIGANRELLMREVVLPLLREVSSEIETLGTPEGGWQGDTSLGEALEQAADVFEDEPRAIPAGPNSPLREFSEIADELGAESCSPAI